MKCSNTCKRILSAILLLAIGFAGGVYYRYVATTGSFLPVAHFSDNASASLNKVAEVIKSSAIENHDEEDLVTAALKGIASSLGDDYSYYYTAEELKEFNQTSSGIMEGAIGVSVTSYAQQIYVTDVYEGMPAEKAGIQKGDIITAVDGTDITGKSVSDAAKLISGEDNTTVQLTISRNKYQVDIVVTRSSGQRQMTTYRIVGDNMLLVHIYSFHGNAVDYFKQAVEYAKAQNCKAMIIDLRDNLGGEVDLFSQIADIMLPKGETFYALDSKGNKVVSCTSDEARYNIPMAVLVNGYSASASEALAGALRDMGGAVLVGTQTYGKGIMQTTYPLSNGGAFKLTTAKYYIPSGVCIQGKGLTPDVVVDLDKDIAEKPWLLTDQTDNQLQKAIEVLTKS